MQRTNTQIYIHIQPCLSPEQKLPAKGLLSQRIVNHSISNSPRYDSHTPEVRQNFY
jgi:hypothetical protein